MEEILALITGRWQSQCLYAAIKNGIIDALDNQTNRTAGSIASELSLNEENVYRLLRALSSTKVVTETENREFSLTDKGKLCAKSHPQSLRDMILWEESPELVQLWLTLPEVVKTGKFVGMPSLGYTDTWDFLEKNPEQGLIFQNAMTSYSMGEAGMVVAAYDFSKSGIQTLVDVGGGHGLLVCSILKAAPSLKGAVFELPATLKDPSLFWASKLGVADRCEYIPGDFFATIPEADGYIMKHILHDWDDQKSIQILQNISKSAKLNAKLFIAETIISPPGGTPKVFDNHFDIHMMVAVRGKERTLKEFIELLDKSGWKFVAEHRSTGHVHLVEAVKI